MNDSQLSVLVGVGFEELALGGQLPVVKWVGATGVQVWFNPEATADPAPVRREVEAAGLVVRSVHLPFGDGYDLSSFVAAEREAAVRRLTAGLDVVAAVGADFAVVHPCWRRDAEMTRRDRRAGARLVTDSLRRLVPAAEARGVRLALENMPPPLIGDRIEDLVGIVAAVDSPTVGICFDTGHAAMTGRPIRMWRKAERLITTMHVHDNGGREDQHLAPFQGTLDWTGLRRQLDRAAYDGDFTLECLEPLVRLYRADDTGWRDRFRRWWRG